MQVTSHNFLNVLEDFEKLLSSCEFYSIDEEMTGKI
jgi:hypothetical protein